MSSEIQTQANTNAQVISDGPAGMDRAAIDCTAASAATEGELKPTRPLRKRTWLWSAGGLCVALPALAMFWTTGGPDVDTSHLPEWFDRAHRIESTNSPLRAGKYFKNVGIFLPKDHSVSAGLSPEWLEQNFTHYLGVDAFAWADPSTRFPDGKLLAGAKVIYGTQFKEFTLICAYAPECGAVNMFVSTPALRDRSQGPPPPRRNDD